jgi:HlyD family secretion protein
MGTDLKDLRIDRADRGARLSPLAKAAMGAAALLALLGLTAGGYSLVRARGAAEVEVMRVAPTSPAAAGPAVILNANGYIVAAHKIQLSSKVMGKVAWIGVDKGDKVRQGQVIVRLEDEEYRAQLEQARGQLASFEARLEEMLAGSRPEEIAEARANLEQARADLDNARVNLERARKLAADAVVSRQALDEAQARHNAAAARVDSLQKRHELVRLGPRREQTDAVRGQVRQARGAVSFFETQLANTVIKAPVAGTILERAVEVGEFVTTSFVGERGAKGYVVTLADLDDLEVELDINQSDFARLAARQRGWVTTDAYPDRRYDGLIRQISPEANRQKATVQVKVKILRPDQYLRPDMNASVAFYSAERQEAARPLIVVPAWAVREGAVFVLHQGRVLRRTVTTGGTTAQGIRIEDGLISGEQIVVNPPAGLKDGDRVRAREH